MRTIVIFLVLLLPSLAWAERLQVFVSVLPQKTFVQKVGGDHVDVRSMVQPGHSPATYDPTPQQISALAETDLYVHTGVSFEKAWMERIRSVNPNMQWLDARAGIDLRIIEHHDHENEEDERDPHVWTSPPLVQQMARNIRDALTALDPANSQEYMRNFDTFAAELATLDRDIRALLKELPNRKFMVFHPAWGYFADTYSLIQVPIEKAGKAPGARSLTALIEQAKREHVKVIFVQPQFDKSSAEQVARAIGGHVAAVDPLSPDYMDNLRNVAQQIAEAMRQ